MCECEGNRINQSSPHISGKERKTGCVERCYTLTVEVLVETAYAGLCV